MTYLSKAKTGQRGIFEPPHDKTKEMACAPNEDSDQTGRIQRRLRSAWACAQSDQSSLCAQWVGKDTSFLNADSEDWSDWADAQAGLSLRWAQTHFVGFVMSRLIWELIW